MDKLNAEIERLRIAASVRAATAVIAPAQVPQSYNLQAPTERQKIFLELPHAEASYGGSAGGGKSSALLMAALEFIEVPNYAALILRRTFQDLAKPGALIDRSHQWLGQTAARWNEQKKQWRFPSGAVLAFGYLDTEQEV